MREQLGLLPGCYPTELGNVGTAHGPPKPKWPRRFSERDIGFEPTTFSLGS
jgi:hypothetical protein